MASPTVYTSIKDAVVALAPTLPVHDWDSLVDILNQPAQSPFLSIDEADSDEILNSVGTPQGNCLTESGIFDIHVFGPARTGFGPLRDIGESLRIGLRYRILTSKVEMLTCPPPVPGLIADGLWSSMIVSAAYRYRYVVPTFVP